MKRKGIIKEKIIIMFSRDMSLFILFKIEILLREEVLSIINNYFQKEYDKELTCVIKY